MYEILPITAHQQSIFQRNPNFRQNHSREFRNKFLRLTLLMAITFTNCYQKKKKKEEKRGLTDKKNLHPKRRKSLQTFLLAVASEWLSSGLLDFRQSAIELSERNGRPFRGISAEFPRSSSVHDIPPRRLQMRGKDTVRDGQWKTSWTIVRRAGILRVPRTERVHRVRVSIPPFRGKANRDDRSCFFSLFSWLSRIDVGGASPLLNFGTAMILGYSNRGSSEPCYQAFPKCPRDMHGLVHYLNNYNGGFFRLFNRIRGTGKYRNGIVVGKKGGRLARGGKL